MSRHYTFAVALLALVACAPAAEKGPTDSPAAAMADPVAVRQVIDSLSVKFADALNRADTATLVATYASDAIVMMPNQPTMRGHDAIRTGFGGMFSQFTVSNAKVTTEDVLVAGDYAIETGRLEMTMTPKQGKAINDKGKYVTVWQRQPDGSWKIIRDIFNSDLPAAP